MFINFNTYTSIPKIQIVAQYKIRQRGSFIKQVVNDLFEYLQIQDEPIIDPNRPVINYGLEVEPYIQQFTNDYYNHNETRHISYSKVDFHKAFNHLDYIPNTVFNKNDTHKLKYPIIAKPAEEHSGEGIESFDTVTDISGNFDLYSEKKTIKREYRAIFFKDNIFLIYERIKQNDDFIYIEQDLNKINTEILYNIDKDFKNLGFTQDFYAIDYIIDDKNKLWVLELNTGIGLGPNTLASLYKVIYEYEYGTLPSDISIYLESIKERYHKQLYLAHFNDYRKSKTPLYYEN